jgi:capsid portal protein
MSFGLQIYETKRALQLTARIVEGRIIEDAKKVTNGKLEKLRETRCKIDD